jgi:hypothetical protein
MLKDTIGLDFTVLQVRAWMGPHQWELLVDNEGPTVTPHGSTAHAVVGCERIRRQRGPVIGVAMS